MILREIVAGLVVGAAVLVWAVFWHGPAQHHAGATETEARLTAATHQAAKEISDEAERARFMRRQCHERGGVYDFSSGQCER